MILLRTAERLGFPRRAPQRHSQLFLKRRQSTNPESPRDLSRADGTRPSHISTSSPSPSPSPSPSATVSGPAWIWTVPLNSYTRLHSRRPYTVQIISTLIVYLAGDVAAQYIVPSSLSGEKSDSESALLSYDPIRTMRALVIGGVAAVPFYHWFLFLGQNFNYTSKAFSIVVKVVINQMVWTPIFNSYFFGMQKALSGANFDEILERIKNTVPRSWINSWKLWPAVTAISLTFVRPELRSLFAGVIAIGWQTYLSVLNQRASRMEAQQVDIASL